MIDDPDAWRHVLAVTCPALLLALPAFLDEVAEWLHEAGVQDAVARHDPAVIFDWMAGLLALQGIGVQAAFSFDAAHGGVRYHEIAAALDRSPLCSRLRSYWSFYGCRYRKGTGLCAEPRHRPHCPLPRHPLRKGGLNQASYSLFLFIRDVSGGDLVGWIDHRLETADPGSGHPRRSTNMREALLGPMINVANTGRKLWSRILLELLRVASPARERWMTTGASFVAVDTLIHNCLHRTGILRRLGMEHAYGDLCYRPGGCAEVIKGITQRINTRALNPVFRWSFRVSSSFPCGSFVLPVAGMCAMEIALVTVWAANKRFARQAMFVIVYNSELKVGSAEIIRAC